MLKWAVTLHSRISETLLVVTTAVAYLFVLYALWRAFK